MTGAISLGRWPKQWPLSKLQRSLFLTFQIEKGLADLAKPFPESVIN
jgi:hypothetical protein